MTIHLYAAGRLLFVPNQPNIRIPCAKPVLSHNFFFENSKKIVNPKNPLSEDQHTPLITCRAVAQKLETQNQKEDQISIRTTPDNAESEVFSDSRRFFSWFFLEKVTLYGEVIITSRHLEAKPLKFSPPKSLCGTVGSPWVSLATLFGFWETLIKFSESMILYGEKWKKCFPFFFFFIELSALPKNSSYMPKKDTSIAGLRMFVAFLVFAKAPGKWLAALAWSSYTIIYIDMWNAHIYAPTGWCSHIERS